MKEINILTILFAAVFLTSCVKLPVHRAKPSVQEVNDEVPFYDYYDSRSKLKYTVQNDDKFVYFILETEYYPTQLKILKNGVKLAIDQEGKRNENLYLHFPLNEDNVNTLNRDVLKQGKEIRNNYLLQIINNLSSTAVWKEGESKQFFTMGFEKQDFDVKITPENDHSLKYAARIPIEKFKEREDGVLPSVGIIIEGLEKLPERLAGFRIRPSLEERSELGAGSGEDRSLTKEMPEQFYVGDYEQMLEITANIQIWFMLDVNY